MDDFTFIKTRYGTVEAKAQYIPNQRARLAIVMIEKMALAIGKIEGEDSAGRAILDNMPPREVVERACDIADLAGDEFEKRGWLIKVPDDAEVLLEQAP